MKLRKLSNAFVALFLIAALGCVTTAGQHELKLQDEVIPQKVELRFDSNIHIAHYAPDGTLKGERLYHNVITNAGLAAVAGLINGHGSIDTFTAIAIGDCGADFSCTAEAAADTTLEREITTSGGERGAATVSRVTVAETNDTAQWVKTFTFTGSHTVMECGVFNNNTSGGTMLNHKTFAAISVGNGDSLQITVKVTVQ